MHIRDLRRIRPMLDLKTASTMATSTVHAKLDYCNSLFLNIDITQINRPQAIQNALDRAVTISRNTTTSLHVNTLSLGPTDRFFHLTNVPFGKLPPAISRLNSLSPKLAYFFNFPYFYVNHHTII